MRVLKVLCFMFVATATFASSVLNFYVEAMRPTEKSYLRVKDKRNSWGAGFEYGWMLGEHFSLGPKLDFSWNLEKQKVTDVNNTKIVKSKERVIMVPISIFFNIDPIPQFMFHPVAHAQVGYNSVFISNVDYDKKNKDNVEKYDGYYNGLYTKFGVDCMVDIGKQISLFIGPQWQISTTERRKKNTEPYERKFNGFGARFGVSVLL